MDSSKMDKHLAEKGKKIQQAFINFTLTSGFDLKKVCKTIVDRGYSYINMNKWFPETLGSGKKTGTKVMLGRMINHLKKILRAGGYELMDENDNPVETLSLDLPFIDEENELRYRLIHAGEKQTQKNLFDLFDIEDDPSIENYSHKFLMLYRKSDNKFSKRILYLNITEGKAIISKGKDKTRDEGTVYLQGNATYIVHIEKEVEEKKPANPKSKSRKSKKPKPKVIFWQIIFPRSKSGKEFFWGSFSKVKRDNLSTHGVVVLISAELDESINLSAIKSLAESFLPEFTKTLSFGKRKLNRLYEDFRDDDYEMELFKALQPYTGTYEGYFTYPPRKRFENWQMTIYENGYVKIWVDANPNKPYSGIARKLSQDLLFIKYDYQEELLDYRAYLVLNTSGKDSSSICDKKSNTPTLYGVLGGIDRDIAHPVVTRIAVRKRDHQPLSLKEHKMKFEVYDLEIKDDAVKLFKQLGRRKLKKFFLGEEKIEYSSLAFLIKLQKEHGL